MEKIYKQKVDEMWDMERLSQKTATGHDPIDGTHFNKQTVLEVCSFQYVGFVDKFGEVDDV